MALLAAISSPHHVLVIDRSHVAVHFESRKSTDPLSFRRVSRKFMTNGTAPVID